MTNESFHDCCREVTGSRCVQTSAWASCSGDDDNNNDDDNNDNDNVQWHHHGGSAEHGQQRGQLLRRQPTGKAGGKATTSGHKSTYILESSLTSCCRLKSAMDALESSQLVAWSTLLPMGHFCLTG